MRYLDIRFKIIELNEDGERIFEVASFDKHRGNMNQEEIASLVRRHSDIGEAEDEIGSAIIAAFLGQACDIDLIEDV